jgi:hypothetical protein
VAGRVLSAAHCGLASAAAAAAATTACDVQNITIVAQPVAKNTLLLLVATRLHAGGDLGEDAARRGVVARVGDSATGAVDEGGEAEELKGSINKNKHKKNMQCTNAHRQRQGRSTAHKTAEKAATGGMGSRVVTAGYCRQKAKKRHGKKPVTEVAKIRHGREVACGGNCRGGAGRGRRGGSGAWNIFARYRTWSVSGNLVCTNFNSTAPYQPFSITQTNLRTNQNGLF